MSACVVSIIFADYQDLIRARCACQIFRLAHQKCNCLRRLGASYLAAKFLHVDRIVAGVAATGVERWIGDLQQAGSADLAEKLSVVPSPG